MQVHGGSWPSLRLSPDEARAELARLLGWDEIAASLQLARFLRFVVEEHLAGRSEQIKERTIAIRALDRESDFNPRYDCIVRVVAGRLRRALERYYATAGADNPLRITIPKGAYQPSFQRIKSDQPPVDGRLAPSTEVRPSAQSLAGRPVVAILPFLPYTHGAEEGDLANMLTQDITIHLSKFLWLDVIDNLMIRTLSGTNFAFAEIASRLHADYVLAGTVRERNRCFRVTVQLTGTDNQRILWAEQYDGKLDPERSYPHDAIVHRVVATLGDTMGVLAQVMRTRARRKRGEVLSVIEAVLTSLDFTAELSQSAYEKALRTARLAVREHEDLALAWANLGARRVEAVGGLVRSVDGSAEEETLFCLNKALRIDPTCVYALWNLSLYHMFCGRLDEALKWAGRALDEEPKSPLDLAGISCAFSSAGQIDDGDALVARAVELSPRLPGWIHWVTVYGHLSRGEERQALAAAENFSLPQSFWDPLFRATVYTMLGEPKQAAAEARQAFRLRPELLECPHELVGRIIHARELRALALDALRTAAS